MFPGELGAAVDIVGEKLPAAERSKFDNGWLANAFNNYANEMMSLHRSLPDVRDKEYVS